ncbi:MAG: NTP transferase domain-containing protein [Phycisphaerae bacterium]|nr:NTP transferase domain-containing protein [Phycisphaerae bacterium]
MVKLDRMLMIGSAGANVGKTELACAVLRRFSGEGRDIVAIKVTTIKEKNGQCPRGGQGCGVCSSLEGVYSIAEETDSNSGKDTGRLLAAGASRVFWLRVLKTHLKEGLAALLDTVAPGVTSICESNSLRNVVEPGVFLVTERKGANIWKPSALEVKEYADRIVVSDGSSFDLDVGRIRLEDGRWLLQARATAIVMAGGSSFRMGADKSMLPIKGRPMIEIVCEQLGNRFEQILISADDVDRFAFLGFDVVPDKVPRHGPLMGIASALQASANELNLVVACDIPHIEWGFVKKMLAEAASSQVDVVVPVTGEDKYEPLFAVYRKSVIQAMDKVLSSGGRKIAEVFALCRVKYVKLDDAGWLVNLNTMAEYEEFRKKQQRSI